MRNPEWWSKLGTLLTGDPDHWVTFSIDGLEDTNHIYRRNVKWDRLMANAKAFIEAGGRAHWDFLIFKHNEHQIEQARQLASQLGFARFVPKKALGVDDGKDLYPMGALSKDGTLDYIIEAPLNPSNRNLETYGKIGGVSANLFTPAEYKQQHEGKLIQNYHKKAYTSIYETLDDTNYDIENKCKIRCKSLRKEIIDIFIDNYGNVLPCCYVGTHLNGNYSDDKTLQLHHEVKKYGLEKFNLNYNSLEDIFKEKHIDNVFTESWTKESAANGKMLFCAHTCGENSSIDRIYTHDGTTQLK
jgi:MoaA/NifB/PqqE/SkfB family radical SAM enzyme